MALERLTHSRRHEPIAAALKAPSSQDVMRLRGARINPMIGVGTYLDGNGEIRGQLLGPVRYAVLLAYLPLQPAGAAWIDP